MQTPPPSTARSPTAVADVDLPTTAQLIGHLTRAAGSSTSGQAFWRTALATLAQGLGCPYASLELQERASVLSLEHAEGDKPEFYRQKVHDLVQVTLADGHCQPLLFRGRGTAVGIGLFVVAIREGAGAVGLVVPCRGPEDAEALQDRLESLVALMSVLAEEAEVAGPKRQIDLDRDSSKANAMRRAADFESTVQLAMAICNRLAGREGFELAAFGRVVGKRVNLLAVSGLDHIDKKGPGICHVQAAMEECLDFGEALVVQPVPHTREPLEGDAAPMAEGRLHKEWHAAVGHVPVCSIPLVGEDGKLAAVLTFRRAPHAHLTREEVEQLEKLVSPFAKALKVVERANRGLLSHAWESLLAAPLTLLSRHHFGRKLALMVLVAACAWAVRGEMPYRVGTVTTIQPRTTRAVGTPIDAILVEAPFAPGDRVTAGALLARFNTDLLEIEARRLRSEVTILEGEEKQAISASDPTAVLVHRSKRDELLARLALIELEIDQAIVRAPLAGTLVEGDLRERIGDTFAKGEPLYRIAGQDGYRLQIVVDERDIDDVQVGQEGSFAAFARPEEKLPFRVSLIHPSAQSQGKSNGYMIEAELLVDASATWARPGMEGSGRIDVGPRSPAWIALHDLVDRARMLSWR